MVTLSHQSAIFWVSQLSEKSHIPCLNTLSLRFIGLSCGEQSELGLSNTPGTSPPGTEVSLQGFDCGLLPLAQMHREHRLPEIQSGLTRVSLRQVSMPGQGRRLRRTQRKAKPPATHTPLAQHGNSHSPSPSPCCLCSPL